MTCTQGVAKICDFGWATIIETTRNTSCGTLDYACPEMLEQKNYDHSIDIWSIGVLTYELLMNKPPFDDKSKNAKVNKILKVLLVKHRPMFQSLNILQMFHSRLRN